MKRLVKLADRPRENRKKVTYILKLGLEVDNSDGDAIDHLRLFKNWTTNKFTQWDKSILEYFLYEYGLIQNSTDDKYFLDFKIEKLLDDDTEKEQLLLDLSKFDDDTKSNNEDNSEKE